MVAMKSITMLLSSYASTASSYSGACNNYRQLLLKGRPLIDVRAPVEYQKGSFPNAVNLPLMNDEERHLVGICYKEKGEAAAIQLGHQLVQGDVKEQRVQAWCDFVKDHPDAVLYCARGGMRSQISQQWLQEAGVDLPKVEGGYKQLRRFLVDYLEDEEYNTNDNAPFFILAGMTGSGKTEIIHQLHQGVDLEGAANHKGSSFGRAIDNNGAQPSQIDFENRIALDLLQLQEQQQDASQQPYANIIPVLEDESYTIGSCVIPRHLKLHMNACPRVLVEISLEERVERIWQEYVVDRHAETLAYYSDDNDYERGEKEFADYLRSSLLGVRKRLGEEATQMILASMDKALSKQHDDSFGSHHDWIFQLTKDYYDPSYRYAIEKLPPDQIVFRGDMTEVLEWLQSQPGGQKGV
jgi:tRNA 2-selenouridine synthase